MKNLIIKAGTVLVLVLVFASMFAFSPVSAQEHGAAPAATAAPTGSAPADNARSNGMAQLLVMSVLGASFAIAIAAAGTGLGQGNAVAKAMEAIGRNPESQKKIFPTLILGLAFIESLALYVLLISLVLLFFNPLLTKL